ncbi:MAG: NAD(P)/FAD-dependent oxidoreductase [Actinomycetota bacterium]|nr:NAD(P)/FAD-dependent oxidoreductase [Actinomycetota bacterium]
MSGRFEAADLVVVGGGPAGLVAAGVAARHGLSVLLVDERATFGGQIYRQPGPGFVVRDARRIGRDVRAGIALAEAARRAGAELRARTAVLSLRGTSVVCLTEGDADVTRLQARRVLVAPGASDRPVPFPGWTLPGVVTAGGAQALVKASRVAPGSRVAFAGSGPLALAFPAQLRHLGVNVVLALEAGPAPRAAALARLAACGWGNAALLRDALTYRAELLRARVPMRYGRVVVRAEGEDRVEAIIHAGADADWRVIPGSEERLEVDTLCVGYGFVPSAELLRLAGCQFGYDEDLGGLVVEVDAWQRTSVAGVLAAGDGTGVRGAAVAKGQACLAALGAAADLGAVSRARAERYARPVRRRLAAKERFRRALLPMHAVGPGIYELATPETVVCRCEEVTLARLEAAMEATADVDAVKSYTRAGMGLCQGRSCQRLIGATLARQTGAPSHSRGGPGGAVRLTGEQIATLAGTTPRPPVRPAAIGALADDTVPDQGLFVDA